MNEFSLLPDSLGSVIPLLLLTLCAMSLLACASGTVPAAAPRGPAWPPPPDAPRVIVYASHYHSVIALPRRQGPGEEWAFGERIWYYEEKDLDFLARKQYVLFVVDALRALFWPNRGVIEVTRSEKSYKVRNPEDKVSAWEIPVTEEGVERMRAWLEGTLGSKTALLDDGWQVYYPASHKYHVLYTCHHYVAQALRAGGVPIHPSWCLFPNMLWRQLGRLGRQHTSEIEKNTK